MVSGGAGYIGSHTCLELLNRGFDIVVVDNLSNSSVKSLERVKKLSGKDITFYEGDLRDEELLRTVFAQHSMECVIHFAGLKAVGESVKEPWKYYDNNLCATLVLTKVMAEAGVKNMIFSSSATVYDPENALPYREGDRVGNCSNPYGWTKLMSEQILRYIAQADQEWSVALLRYFNPIGAHESGEIGEDPRGIPNNLMPYISQVAVGRLDHLNVYGSDYDTPDGTGVRDYIHVVDLAAGHVAAIDYVLRSKGCSAFNLGTGVGYSVLDMIHNFQKASGLEIPYQFAERRPGDLPIFYADPSKSEKELHWHAERNLLEMCRDSWEWQRKNPFGYDT